MPVYPVAAGKASCRVAGCACRDRMPRYPSDLTDQQWKLLEPDARAAMTKDTVAFVAPLNYDVVRGRTVSP